MNTKIKVQSVELRTPLPVPTWTAFVAYKGPRRLSWPQVLERAVAALLREEEEAVAAQVVPEDI